jgi:hypothetical protein
MKLLLVGPLLTLVLLGCSGDDDDEEPSVTPAAVATIT